MGYSGGALERILLYRGDVNNKTMGITRIVALVTTVLIIAAGLCLLDADHSESGPDLCGALSTLGISPSVGFYLGVSRSYILPIALLQPYFSDLPYPPPKR